MIVMLDFVNRIGGNYLNIFSVAKRLKKKVIWFNFPRIKLLNVLLIPQHCIFRKLNNSLRFWAIRHFFAILFYYAYIFKSYNFPGFTFAVTIKHIFHLKSFW